jgi:hypothetical protein
MSLSCHLFLCNQYYEHLPVWTSAREGGSGGREATEETKRCVALTIQKIYSSEKLLLFSYNVKRRNFC